MFTFCPVSRSHSHSRWLTTGVHFSENFSKTLSTEYSAHLALLLFQCCGMIKPDPMPGSPGWGSRYIRDRMLFHHGICTQRAYFCIYWLSTVTGCEGRRLLEEHNSNEFPHGINNAYLYVSNRHAGQQNLIKGLYLEKRTQNWQASHPGILGLFSASWEMFQTGLHSQAVMDDGWVTNWTCGLWKRYRFS